MKIQTVILIAVILFCSTGCLPSLLSKKEASDYFSEGFINQHCFQVLVSKTPSKDVSGLVDSRENSYFQAKKNIHAEVQKKLFEYTLRNNCGIVEKGTNLNDLKTLDIEYIKKQTKKFLRYGHVAEEYYKKDKSVVLVYRITRSSLKKRIASISCKKIQNKVTGE